MKSILCALAFLVAGAVHAGDLIQLPIPAEVPRVTYPSAPACAASAFNDDKSIRGACRSVRATACSGRGCQPVKYTTTYVAVWSAQGEPLVATACSLLRHHLPQADELSYYPGFDASTCPPLNFNPTGTTVTLNGKAFYYVTTNSVGSELVNSDYAGFLYLP